MAELARKVNVGEAKLTTMQKNDPPKDFLQRSSPTQLSMINQEKKNEVPADINLGLSLSLGGTYCENSNEKPLTRSSSIVGTITLKKDAAAEELNSSSFPKSFLSLSRSSSVPTDSEQEQRKATLVALARRRLESVDNFMRGRTQMGVNDAREKSLAKEPMPASPSEMAAWAAASAAKSPVLCRALVQIQRQTSLHSGNKLDGLEGLAAENGATHSQSSPLQSKLMVGANINGKLVRFGEQYKLGNASKRGKLLNNGFQDTGMDVMKQMPSVTTTGDGPNGRKIEGFLFMYRKGQVTIVCVCHGSFFSPAEFVRHAGGKAVANPMKHITVSSFSF